MAHRIAIIGAGFSGTATALALHRAARATVRLRLFEASGRFGPGVAYRTESLYVGPWLRARDWEATAIAELRACAESTARALLAELGAG